MKDHFVDDRSFAAKFDNEALQFRNAEPSAFLRRKAIGWLIVGLQHKAAFRIQRHTMGRRAALETADAAFAESWKGAVASRKTYERNIFDHGLQRRREYEYPMPIEHGRQALLLLPPSRIIHKIRYDIPHGGLVWSVDRFQDANAGLVLAEVELSNPDQRIELPPWITEEITHDPRYGSSRLARGPVPSAARAA